MLFKLVIFLSMGTLSISSLNGMNPAIFDDLNHSIEFMKKKYNAIDANPTIKDLAENVIKNCAIKTKKPIIILQRNHGDNSYTDYSSTMDQWFMILGVKHQALDQIECAAYHEGGHLFYKDCETNLQELKEAMKKRNFGLLANTALAFGAYCYLKNYLTTFKSSAAGSLLGTLGFFGLILKLGYQNSCRHRMQEIRADNFAYEHLLKLNRSEIIMGDIFDYLESFEGTGAKIRDSTPYDTYPTAYERAKNGIAFLRERGIDPANSAHLPKTLDSGIKQHLPRMVSKYFSNQ